MLIFAQNTSVYAIVRTCGGTPNARIHAKVCGIWLAQRDVPVRSTAARNVASSGANKGCEPCGWMVRRGVEGGVRERRGKEVVLRSVVHVVVRRSVMGWWCKEAFEAAGRREETFEVARLGDPSPEEHMTCAGARTSASASHPVSSALVSCVCNTMHPRHATYLPR